MLSKVVLRAVSKKVATTNTDFQTIMSQVLFPKLATSNLIQKIAKSHLKFAIGTFPKVITNTALFSKNCTV